MEPTSGSVLVEGLSVITSECCESSESSELC